jgi:hypothetical protein
MLKLIRSITVFLILFASVILLLFLPIQNRAISLPRDHFVKINDNGFGDPNNSYAWSMAWFNDKLYVGTLRNLLEVRALGQDPPAFDPYPVPIPADISEINLEAEIWEYSPRKDTWKMVYRSPDSILVNGDVYDIARDSGYRCLTVYTDSSSGEQALYVGGATWFVDISARILRGSINNDGEIEFEPLKIEYAPGSEPPPDIYPKSFRTLVPFKGDLYTTPVATTGGVGGQHSLNPVVYRIEIRKEGEEWIGTFHRVSEPGFGNEDNMTIFEMIDFNGYLYAGTGNPIEGYEVWKTNALGDPLYHWIPVLLKGAYRGKKNEGTACMHVFKDQLYIGSGIQAGFHSEAGLFGPPEIIRINMDDSWELVCGEPRYTPDGFKQPVSGSGPGFDNPVTGYFWRMAVHGEWLYVSSYDISSILLPYFPIEDFPPEILPPKLRKILEEINPGRIVNLFGGFDLWKTSDGINWDKVTSDGFKNPLNVGARTLVSTPKGLFLGTANPFTIGNSLGDPGGAEVWLERDTLKRADSNVRNYSAPYTQALPDGSALCQNFPNPCNPDTWIPYQLSEPSNVKLDIYDVNGKLIRSIGIGHKEAGIYKTKEKAIYWDGRNNEGEEVSSGIYFYQIQAGSFTSTKKAMILK